MSALFRTLGRPASVAVLIIAFFVLAAAPALAQSGPDTGQPPPPPPGPGELTVQIVLGDTDGSASGLPVALYALGPDGTPGLANGETDASGRAVFAGISNDPAIIYLVGARYAEIPFGERITFAEGATDVLIEINVATPTAEIQGVTVEEVRSRIDWMGDRIIVTEIIRLNSSGDRVIQLPSDNTAGLSIIERSLPLAAKDFNPGPTSIGDELAFDDGRVRFFGPLYPGEQRVEYQFSLPIERGARTLDFPVELREATERVVFVAGTSGIEISGDAMSPSRDLSSETGQLLASWARGVLPAGQPLNVLLTLPESRLDGTALTIPRADVWLDLDDTRVNANVDLSLNVAPGAPITGTPEAPLMHVVIPDGAELQGVSPESEAMGLVPTPDGGFDVIGPIGAGEHSFSYTYRLASRPDGAELGMRFPREIQTLNVLIADTGLALDSSRLHRRRPFRNGTRNYLHREAYNVTNTEVVDLRLEPLRATGLPRNASISIIGGASLAGAFFIISPLLGARRREEAGDPELDRLREEREAVYVAIADLEHDFETGKLESADYEAMLSQFKDQAIALMRSERERTDKAAPITAAISASPNDSSNEKNDHAGIGDTAESKPASLSALIDTNYTAPTTSTFCPSCGGRIDPKWRFCSHCGGELQPSEA